jgi:hypothetical protein
VGFFRGGARGRDPPDLSGVKCQSGPATEFGNTEYQASMVVLGATAGDAAVTIGIVKTQAGVFKTRSPALAPKHLGRGSSE